MYHKYVYYFKFSTFFQLCVGHPNFLSRNVSEQIARKSEKRINIIVREVFGGEIFVNYSRLI